MDNSKEVVKKLLQIKAIQLNLEKPFIWSSGIESPIYCDNRVVWSYPGIRTFIIDQMINLLERPQDINAIVGVATAGIAPAAMIAREMSLPLAYVRSKSKGHGMKNLLEGHLNGNERVVVVEDLISTGGSSIKAVKALEKIGIQVDCVISVFSYNLSIAQSNFDKAGVKYRSLAKFEDLLNYGLEAKFLKEKEVNKLNKWKSSL